MIYVIHSIAFDLFAIVHYRMLFAASAFRKLSSIYVFSYFPFGFEGRIWDLIVSVPDHCLSFYFVLSCHLFHFIIVTNDQLNCAVVVIRQYACNLMELRII